METFTPEQMTAAIEAHSASLMTILDLFLQLQADHEALLARLDSYNKRTFGVVKL